jgi:SH3-like domain-containing protein
MRTSATGTVARLICVALALVTATPAVAQDEGAVGEVTNLPVPRYVSLRSSEINVRRGPGLDYRKDWVFHRAGLPVRIIEEYGDWRRIVDKDDAGGWVYHAMLTGRRTVLVTAEETVLHSEPSETAQPVARAEQGVVARLEQCRPDWCEIEAEGLEGWVSKAAIWGVDPEEVVEP